MFQLFSLSYCIENLCICHSCYIENTLILVDKDFLTEILYKKAENILLEKVSNFMLFK